MRKHAQHKLIQPMAQFIQRVQPILQFCKLIANKKENISIKIKKLNQKVVRNNYLDPYIYWQFPVNQKQ
jgi:hypothetical protein